MLLGLWKMQICSISVNFAMEEERCNVQDVLEISISSCSVKIKPTQFIKNRFFYLLLRVLVAKFVVEPYLGNKIMSDLREIML